MSSSDFLIQATLKRLIARTDNLLKDGPGRLREELKVFYEEVIAEADRMKDENSASEDVQDLSSPIPSDIDLPQEKLDRLRLKVSQLTRKIEEIMS